MNDSSDFIFPSDDYQGEVGLVAYSDFKCEEPLDFELGGHLDSFNVRYETYGRLNDEKSNAILVCHALTGDHPCAGVYSLSDRKSGWEQYNRALQAARHKQILHNMRQLHRRLPRHDGAVLNKPNDRRALQFVLSRCDNTRYCRSADEAR